MQSTDDPTVIRARIYYYFIMSIGSEVRRLVGWLVGWFGSSFTSRAPIRAIVIFRMVRKYRKIIIAKVRFLIGLKREFLYPLVPSFPCHRGFGKI